MLAIADAYISTSVAHGQFDTDGDGDGDACDADADDDGVLDGADNCPVTVNPAQEDTDTDGFGDVCDVDLDADGVLTFFDNCPSTSNADQIDLDRDGLGDACDVCPVDVENDADGDGVCEGVDNCRNDANPTQDDVDGDAIGDACDVCAGFEPGQFFASRTRVDFKKLFGSRRDDIVSLKGEFVLPFGNGFSVIQPLVDPVSVAFVVEEDGGLIARIDLPTDAFAGSGTAGWRLSSSGIWTFTDKTKILSPEGTISLRLKDAGGGRVAVKLKGKNANYTDGAFASTGDPTVRAQIGFGDSAAGICGETDFEEEDCERPSRSRTIRCREP